MIYVIVTLQWLGNQDFIYDYKLHRVKMQLARGASYTWHQHHFYIIVWDTKHCGYTNYCLYLFLCCLKAFAFNSHHSEIVCKFFVHIIWTVLTITLCPYKTEKDMNIHIGHSIFNIPYLEGVKLYTNTLHK